MLKHKITTKKKQLENYEECERLLQEMVSLFEKSNRTEIDGNSIASLYLNLSIALFSNKKYIQAENYAWRSKQLFSTTHKLRPLATYSSFKLALFQAEMDKNEEAITNFSSVIEDLNGETGKQIPNSQILFFYTKK